MRAIIWAAVSSKPQLKGDSLDAQIRDAEEVCERFDWEMVATLRIPGSSRDYIFFPDAAGDIPAYREFQHLCENRSADVLVCRGRDRLGRTDALIAQVEALAQKAGMQLYSMAMPSAIVSPDTVGQDRGTLYAAAIERASAQAEMIELRRRHAMGMRARIRRGLHPNKPPYGYRYDNTRTIAVQVPEEVAAIRKMAELYLAGWGIRRIVGYLNSRGIAPPMASQWQPRNVREVLFKRFYAGWVHFGDTIAPGKHEPIFSAGQWKALRQEKQRRQRTRGKAALPYSGIVRCAVCTHAMSISRIREQRASGQIMTYQYYRCTEGQARSTECRPEKHHTQVRVEAIRGAILEKARELEDPERLAALCRDRSYQVRTSLQQQKAETEDALEQLSDQITRLLEAHTRWQTIGTAEFDQLMTEAAENRKHLQDRLVQTTVDLEELPDPEVRAEELRALAKDITPVLDSSDIEEANAWLSKRISTVWCKANQVLSVELI